MEGRGKRDVKPVGFSKDRQSALQDLAKLRAGGGKRSQQYKLETDPGIFKEANAEEPLQDDKDFIVDDEGIGYLGGENEEYSDEGEAGGEGGRNRKRRDNAAKGQQSMEDMLRKAQGLKNTAPINQKSQSTKQSEDEKSKELMNSILNQFDNPNLEDISKFKEKRIAFNREEELANEFADVYPEVQAAQKEVAPIPATEPSKAEPMIDSAQDKTASAVQEKSASAIAKRVVPESAQPKVEIPEKAPEPDEWAKQKAENFEDTKKAPMADTISMLQKEQVPLKPNEDGSLNFFWLDAFEEPNNHNEVYFFGKVAQGSEYKNCCLIVRNLERVMYAVPRSLAEFKEPDSAEFANMHAELEKLRKIKFTNIKEWRGKPIDRAYNFELPILHGKHKFFKIKYSAAYPPLPADLSGQYFCAIIGTTMSMLDTVIIKKKIQGPCWLRIKKFSTSKSHKFSWCPYEIIVDNPKAGFTCDPADEKREMPPITAMSISLKYAKQEKKPASIVMISCIMNSDFHIDRPNDIARLKYPSQTFLTQLEQKSPLPFDFTAVMQKAKSPVKTAKDEKGLLDLLLSHIAAKDPDIIVAHDLYGYTLDMIITRLNAQKVKDFSKIGRLKKGTLPKLSSNYQCRMATSGRLLCDTYLSAKDMLPKESDYKLRSLAKTQLNEELKEFQAEQLPKLYNSSAALKELVEHTEKEAFLSLKLMHKLAVLPLTKQLANIAGHYWIRSLQFARAERNEMLLMHEFHKKKFILPDKVIYAKKEAQVVEEENEDDEEKQNKKAKKKAAYEGGLVLDPRAGFYDRYIILLDFQSLYPSLIQEFNLCFTTVKRSPSQALPKGGKMKQQEKAEAASSGKASSENELREVSLLDEDEIGGIPTDTALPGILPKVLENLVSRRRAVKKEMAASRDPVIIQQCDIKQRALKLSANSMYGCLGFTNSRFYAKPIAALITSLGRQTLQRTADIAINELQLEVIYGDTDSIMINSNKDNLKEAIDMAKQVKERVNKKYKKLEIEIDGVFKSLLLLKKKKYAARKLKDPYDESKGIYTEVKGLDLVRHDWCKLSKDVSGDVLKIILSGQNREDMTKSLNDIFRLLGENIKANKLPFSDYIITKEITKPLDEYKDGRRMPHVKVAQDMKKKGEKETNIVGHHIPYIICSTEEDKEIHLAERAFHPTDVKLLKKTIDYRWYSAQQVIPPIKRLLEPFTDFNMDQMYRDLDLDPSMNRRDFKHSKNQENDEEAAEIIRSEETRYNDLDRDTLFKLMVFCPTCRKEAEIRMKAMVEKEPIRKLNCTHCSNPLPLECIQNRITAFLHKIMKSYYASSLDCHDMTCGTSTRTLLNSLKCPKCRKPGKPTVNEKRVQRSLYYLKALCKLLEHTQALLLSQRKQFFHLVTIPQKDPKTDPAMPPKFKAMAEEAVEKSGYEHYDTTDALKVFGMMSLMGLILIFYWNLSLPKAE